MANVRYDHVTMFILYLLIAVFSFSVKSSSLALASKAKISLHYSHLCTLYFKKTQTRISRLLFAVNVVLYLSKVSTDPDIDTEKFEFVTWATIDN